MKLERTQRMGEIFERAKEVNSFKQEIKDETELIELQ